MDWYGYSVTAVASWSLHAVIHIIPGKEHSMVIWNYSLDFSQQGDWDLTGVDLINLPEIQMRDRIDDHDVDLLHCR